MTGESLLRKFISEDLYNELRYLLVAATQWAAYDQLVDKCGTRVQGDFPRHFKVLAMDSAFLHSRSLYEFFTSKDGKSSKHLLTWKALGLSERLTSPIYDKFRVPLHKRLMHLEPDRPGEIAIKDEVVTIAKDVLALWDKFAASAEVSKYAAELDEARARAILDSNETAQRYTAFGFSVIFV
ncbi:hypothetical protein [Mycobacterium riyadhense]|uniref:hypothetical protein n=1 Tax=Mycobacterium riyadhense TaxID=486698 RepID=UPI00194E7824|nr:hypothetical protein [Mycobacterium riyadhense]